MFQLLTCVGVWSPFHKRFNLLRWFSGLGCIDCSKIPGCNRFAIPGIMTTFLGSTFILHPNRAGKNPVWAKSILTNFKWVWSWFVRIYLLGSGWGILEGMNDRQDRDFPTTSMSQHVQVFCQNALNDIHSNLLLVTCILVTFCYQPFLWNLGNRLMLVDNDNLLISDLLRENKMLQKYWELVGRWRGGDWALGPIFVGG